MGQSWSCIVVAALAGLTLSAQVKPGQNLLLNGRLDAEQTDSPPFWEVSGEALIEPGAGPDSGNALVFRNVEPVSTTISASVRQQGLALVRGGQYKISAWIKSRNFTSKSCGVIVHNHGWHSSQGIRNIPGNSDGWKRFERTFELTTSQNNLYGVAIYANSLQGELQVADVKLEALSKDALEKSISFSEANKMAQLRLVPWYPLLNKVPLDKPRLDFHLFGPRYIDGFLVADHDLAFAVDGKEVQRAPLQERINRVVLKNVPKGDHHLEVKIVKRDTGGVLLRDHHQITLIELPHVNTSGHKRLNNLVTEVLNIELKPQSEEQKHTFFNPKDGWVFASVVGAASGSSLEVVESGVETTAKNGGLECFSLLKRGEQQVVVKGAGTGGRLICRAIVEIFNYPACANSQVPQNGKYDWEFHKRHILPAVTTLNGGRIEPEHLPELRARGLRWLANLNTTTITNRDHLVSLLERSAGMTEPQYDGVTCDEQFFSRPALSFYSAGLPAYANPDNRLIYSWIVGKPAIPGVHHEFFSAALNASRGNGRALYEAYCHTKPDERSARDYIKDRIAGTMRSFKAYYPHVGPGTGMVLGNFNQVPIISLDSEPSVDYKYYLDMQLHLVANDPLFADLGLVGYWGSYYSDEEQYRWSFKLLRHYCVEGNTEMLSPAYGFRYNPGHLLNCDFDHGLTNWNVSAAHTDSVAPASFAGYGKNSQGRWGCGSGKGRNFCLFKRTEEGVNRISQLAVNLEPGRLYTLQFVTADHQDMVAKRFAPRRHGIEAKLGAGAIPLPERSYVFVDKRNRGRKKDDGYARINLHHIRFKATARETLLSFDDTAAKPGEELALNYIMLKPYFME